MNSMISVDLNEIISIDTDLSPTAKELLELVNKQPFLINMSLKHSLQQLHRYVEDNFGCTLEVNALCTIEGHTSVDVRLKHFAVKTDASVILSMLTEDVSLLKGFTKTLAALLPLPYTVCD